MNNIQINKIHNMVLGEIFIDYKTQFSEDEKVQFKDGQLYVFNTLNKKVLTLQDLLSIKKDVLHNKRVENNSKFTKDELVYALHNMDNPKYKLLFINPEDLIDITFDEMIEILSNRQTSENTFEYIAYTN